jgi:RNA-directed DNA polymerase
MKPILSLRELSYRLNTPIETLRAIAENVTKHYRVWSEKDEKTSKVRVFREPSPELKNIQKRINKILEDFGLHDSAHGGVKGRSPRTNALLHLGQPIVVTLDVHSFYPSVRHTWVYRMFRHELAFGRDVARLLTRLTTLDAQLPQGAPTSPAIGNMFLKSVDMPISARSRAANVVNTRFVDDFAFSGDNEPQALINPTAKALSRRGLSISRKPSKLKVMPRSGPQVVTGLNVNSKAGPSVPKQYRDAVRASIHRLSQMPPGAERNSAIASIRGKIRYVAGYNPGSARRLEAYIATRAGP